MDNNTILDNKTIHALQNMDMEAVVKGVLTELERRGLRLAPVEQPNTPTEPAAAVKTDSVKPNRWYTTKEAIAITGLHQSTICTYARLGKWPARRGAKRGWFVKIPEELRAISTPPEPTPAPAPPPETPPEEQTAINLEPIRTEPATPPQPPARAVADRVLTYSDRIRTNAALVDRLVLPALEQRWTISGAWLFSTYYKQTGALPALANELDKVCDIDAIVKVRIGSNRDLVPITIKTSKMDPARDYKPSYRIGFSLRNNDSWQLESWFAAVQSGVVHGVRPLRPEVMVSAVIVNNNLRSINCCRIEDLRAFAMDALECADLSGVESGAVVRLRRGVSVSSARYGNGRAFIYVDCELLEEFTEFDRPHRQQASGAF